MTAINRLLTWVKPQNKMKKSAVPAVYGQASVILKYAKQSYEALFKYIEMQAKGLSLAETFLRINPDYL